jgi:hypothetical protein
MMWSVATSYMSGAVLYHFQDRREHSTHGSNLKTLTIAHGRERIIVTKQLIGSVDEMTSSSLPPVPNRAVALNRTASSKDDIDHRNLRMIGVWSDGFVCARGPLSISHDINLSASEGGNRK